MSDTHLIRGLANVLDACMPSLEAAARREAAKPQTGMLRNITAQERLKCAKQLLAAAKQRIAAQAA